MSTWFKWPTWGKKTVEQLEEEKAAAIAKITEDYDKKIEAAEAASPAAEGTTDLGEPEAATEEATGGRRRRKTKRSKKSKSKRTRTGRKSNRS